MNTPQLLINGRLVPGSFTMPVINPATEESLIDCPRASPDQLNEAVAAARNAFASWSATSLQQRREILLAMADRIETNLDELARILTQEQGKPLRAARGEVKAACGFFRYGATLDLPEVSLEDSKSRRVTARRKPLGVVAAILPWNFPLLTAAAKMPGCLLAGNTMVIKPSPTTPLATLRFAELIADLVPAGVVNVITDNNDLGDLLTAHPDVRKVTFTGSTTTGRKVMRNAADSLKRVTLELGGNDAGIVLPDADPKAIAPRIFQSVFQNSGQVCLALKRLYVHDSIYDAMCDELVTLADKAVVGDGFKEGVELGPLQNRAQFERVKALIKDARSCGSIIAGGEPVEGPGFFIRPTLVRDIKDGTRLVDEEQFGPVLPIIRYYDVDDAVRLANASSYGLGGSVWGSDEALAVELASRLEAGTVWVNKHQDISPSIPFGGAKQSGIGVEYGRQGLEEFTQLQIVNLLPKDAG